MSGGLSVTIPYCTFEGKSATPPTQVRRGEAASAHPQEAPAPSPLPAATSAVMMRRTAAALGSSPALRAAASRAPLEPSRALAVTMPPPHASSSLPFFSTAAARTETKGALVIGDDVAARGWLAAAAAVVGAAVTASTMAEPARSDASSSKAFKTFNTSSVGSLLPYDRAHAVMEWLTEKGVTFGAAEVRPMDAGTRRSAEEHGMGLYVKRPETTAVGREHEGRDPDGGASVQAPRVSPVHSVGLSGFIASLLGGVSGPAPTVMLSVPLHLAITVATAADHPELGATFREMLADGGLDERLAVMLLLVVERRRGDASPLAPYLNAMPAAFHTPLHYSPDEMDGLRGTNLHAAAVQQRERLRAVLENHAQPAAKRLFAALRRAPPALTEEEAASGQKRKRRWFGMLGPRRERVRAGPVTAEEFEWAYSAFFSRAMSLPIGPDPSNPTVEGIVPGLDFANHSGSAPNARWAVRGVRGGLGAAGISVEGEGDPRVELLCEPGATPGLDEEIRLSYGEKSNEELLFLYGFVERDNPHDALVLQPPWARAAASGDRAAAIESREMETLRAREALCRARGLTPQVALPLVPPTSGLAALPRATVAALEVWGLSPAALEAELRAELGEHLDEQTPSPTAAEKRAAAIAGLVEALAAQTAMLEEATRMGGAGSGASGAGSVKAGSKAALAAAVRAAAGRRVDEVVAADPLAPPVLRQTAVYRAGVARMTRAYVDAVGKWR